MSYYYNYYIGYKGEDEKLYPLGPFDSFGDLRCAFFKSRSYASDIHEDFWLIKESQISDELRKHFEITNWKNEKEVPVKWLDINDLPTGSFIKTGYFLIEDVKRYEADYDTWDIFYEHLSPEVYAAKLSNELALGKPENKLDCEGNEIEEHSASEYMYYAYPDYNSREYEAHVIRLFADSLESYRRFKDGTQIVVLETEG